MDLNYSSGSSESFFIFDQTKCIKKFKTRIVAKGKRSFACVLLVWDIFLDLNYQAKFDFVWILVKIEMKDGKKSTF